MTGPIVRFTVHCEMPERWAPHFLGMLAHMEKLGRLGSSRRVSMFADGDGDFRPRFAFLDAPVPPAVPSLMDEDGNTTFDAG